MIKVRPIKVGFNPDFPPFNFIENGTPSGIVIDRVIKAFHDAKIDFEFVSLPLTELTKNLLEGEIDVLAGLAPTPTRMATMAFSKPLITTGGAWFVSTVNSSLELNEAPNRVVTPAVGPLVAMIKKNYPDIILTTCEDYDAALDEVLAGKVDAAALNWHVGMMLVDQKYAGKFHRPLAPFSALSLAMATKVGDTYNIIERLNPYILDQWSDTK